MQTGTAKQETKRSKLETKLAKTAEKIESLDSAIYRARRERDVIKIGRVDWTKQLPEAIHRTKRGGTIGVATADMKQLAERAAVRMGRPDITFVVDEAAHA